MIDIKKVKVGDKVIWLGTKSNSTSCYTMNDVIKQHPNIKKGEVFTIQTIYNDNNIDIQELQYTFHCNDFDYYNNGFKIGDKVKCIKSGYSTSEDEIGKIFTIKNIKDGWKAGYKEFLFEEPRSSGCVWSLELGFEKVDKTQDRENLMNIGDCVIFNDMVMCFHDPKTHIYGNTKRNLHEHLKGKLCKIIDIYKDNTHLWIKTDLDYMWYTGDSVKEYKRNQESISQECPFLLNDLVMKIDTTNGVEMHTIINIVTLAYKPKYDVKETKTYRLEFKNNSGVLHPAEDYKLITRPQATLIPDFKVGDIVECVDIRCIYTPTGILNSAELSLNEKYKVTLVKNDTISVRNIRTDKELASDYLKTGFKKIDIDFEIGDTVEMIDDKCLILGQNVSLSSKSVGYTSTVTDVGDTWINVRGNRPTCKYLKTCWKKVNVFEELKKEYLVDTASMYPGTINEFNLSKEAIILDEDTSAITYNNSTTWTKEKLVDKVIVAKTTEESTKIQQVLFDLGYVWNGKEKGELYYPKNYDDLPHIYLHLHKEKRDNKDKYFICFSFSNHTNNELTFNDIFNKPIIIDEFTLQFAEDTSTQLQKEFIDFCNGRKEAKLEMNSKYGFSSNYGIMGNGVHQILDNHEEYSRQLQMYNRILFRQHMEENKMAIEKPETQLDITACKQAKEDVIKATIDAKKVAYNAAMKDFISYENAARDYRKRADELKEKLGITAAELKELF